MKKIDNKYIPSRTDIKKAQSHARAIENKYPEFSGLHVETYFDIATGEFSYCELTQNSYMVTPLVYIQHREPFYSKEGRVIENENNISEIIKEISFVN